MSVQYDQYLAQHKVNVKKAFNWFENNLFSDDLIQSGFNLEWQTRFNHHHDASKSELDEYVPYDAYFYGGNRSYDVVQNFNKAWLLHIHRNPHHWQYWVLINDDPKESLIALEMPNHYVVEMICDWWAFSWAKGDLTEIFSWYDEHKDYIKLHMGTRIFVEHILDLMKRKLEG